MVDKIFYTTDEEGQVALTQLQAKGYRQSPENQASPAVSYDGRVWSKHMSMAKDVALSERIRLFFSVIFRKIALIFGRQDAHIQRDWHKAWGGKAIVVIYKDTQFIEKVEEHIYDLWPAGQLQKRANKAFKRWLSIVPTADGVKVRLSQGLIQNGFSAFLEQYLSERAINYVKGPLAFNQEGMQLKEEFCLSKQESLKLFEQLLDFQAANINDVALEFLASIGKVNPSIAPIKGPFGQILAVETIAHSLGQPAVDLKELPLVEFNDFGMTIKVPSTRSSLSRHLQQLFLLNKDPINETIRGLNYTAAFTIKRDHIEAFLASAQLGQVKGYNTSYHDLLVAQGLIHKYQPTISDDPIDALNFSLKALVPNAEQQAPYVSLHPKGWLSIRLENGVYYEKLKKYLKAECDFEKQAFINGKTYNREIRIQKEELAKFLELLGLKKTASNEDFLTKLQEFSSPGAYSPCLEEQTSIKETIAKSLASLCAEPIGYNELPQVAFCGQNLTITIPQALNERTVAIGPGREISFSAYLGHVYGITVDNGVASIPCVHLLSFLESDLALRELPVERRQERFTTFYNLLCTELNLYQNGQAQRESIRGWHLRNPSIPVPADFPRLDDCVIEQKAYAYLQEGGIPQAETYRQVIAQTLDGCRTEGANPFICHAIVAYLTLIVEPAEDQRAATTREKQIKALLAIGDSCGNSCFNGRLAKIQRAYQEMYEPAGIEAVLLKEVEDFKNDMLTQVFINDAQSVHRVSWAQEVWGDELGLDREAGCRDNGRDPPREGDPAQFKAAFMRLCQQHLVDAVFDRLSNKKDEYDSLLNANLFFDRLQSALRKRGYTTEEITAKIEELLPTDDMERVALTRAAVVELLIDIGVLYS